MHNDSHSGPRQNSNLTHELAHGLLHHEPTPALDGMTGCRNFNSTNEDGASWLAGELLVTEEMALAEARRQFTRREAASARGKFPNVEMAFEHDRRLQTSRTSAVQHDEQTKHQNVRFASYSRPDLDTSQTVKAHT